MPAQVEMKMVGVIWVRQKQPTRSGVVSLLKMLDSWATSEPTPILIWVFLKGWWTLKCKMPLTASMKTCIEFLINFTQSHRSNYQIEIRLLLLHKLNLCSAKRISWCAEGDWKQPMLLLKGSKQQSSQPIQIIFVILKMLRNCGKK